ncbi:MAG: MFS transporter [Gammaproteobacteria bacterium]|nr:MFS transporter [Gammaproteobacteria bacterium]
MDHKLAILSAVVLSALGAMFYNLLPLFVGVAQDYRQLDNRSVGALSSMFFAGHTLTASSAFFWIRRINWKRIALLSLCVAGTALLFAANAQNQGVMMLWMFIAGGAFSAVYGISATALGDTSNPARWYGLKISAEAMLGAILLFLLPRTLVSSHGFTGLMTGMVLVVALLAPALIWLPRSIDSDNVPKSGEINIPRQQRLAVWIGLFVAMAFVFSATMVWTFVERIANSAGLEPVIVGKILSMTLVFAMLGSLCAMVLGDRFGAGKPLAAATVIFLVALTCLSDVSSVTRYAVGSCSLTLAIGLGITYVLTIVADLDVDGRYVVLTVPAIGIGVMAAPAVGGLLVTSQEYSAILWVSGLTVVIALIAGLNALQIGSGYPFKAKQ